MRIKLHGHDVYINGVLLGTLVRASLGSAVWTDLACRVGLVESYPLTSTSLQCGFCPHPKSTDIICLDDIVYSI
jgi:hypothetical protein